MWGTREIQGEWWGTRKVQGEWRGTRKVQGEWWGTRTGCVAGQTGLRMCMCMWFGILVCCMMGWVHAWEEGSLHRAGWPVGAGAAGG